MGSPDRPLVAAAGVGAPAGDVLAAALASPAAPGPRAQRVLSAPPPEAGGRGRRRPAADPAVAAPAPKRRRLRVTSGVQGAIREEAYDLGNSLNGSLADP